MRNRAPSFGAALLVLFANAASAQSSAACPPLGWGGFLNPGPQDYEVVERIELDKDRIILGIKFGPLVGERAKVFLFYEMTETCNLGAVSLGSYAATNAFRDGDRIYHLDLYEPGLHATMDFFDTPPSYEDIRARALEALD